MPSKSSYLISGDFIRIIKDGNIAGKSGVLELGIVKLPDVTANVATVQFSE
jgi:hypothetical protein